MLDKGLYSTYVGGSKWGLTASAFSVEVWELRAVEGFGF